MVESEFAKDYPTADVYVNTGDAEADQTVQQLLDGLDITEVIKRTLLAVNVRKPVMLTLMITGDEEIHALNWQYRQQDKPTDVLSFPLLDEPLVEAPAEWLWQAQDEAEVDFELPRVTRPLFVTPAELITNLGDIAISWPTVQRQASAAGQSSAAELLFLLCHGVLHLVGYDDQTEAGYAEMVRLQKEILASLKAEHAYE